MELREFAERVLFATSLDEKLLSPATVTDDHPGPALLTPSAPGRPRELRFKPQVSGKAEFPGAHLLEQERERGKLLHFFANHELLATELMALVLLRFPDAPAAFRTGVFQTLKDEQGHTRLYLERMKSCGIQFGDLPVSGFFWRAVSTMENPMDYVSSLCLTFEQANLDFAKHFAQGFAKIGDDTTAKLLDKIYRDEIGHVAYGLKWFRRWKNPAESDWDAFCRVLKFPLSPQRAKGFTLNIAGRQAAGLDPQFIAALNVYSQSKGRTPSVFVFNPFAEGRIAEGKSFNPTKHQAQLARDLENLPQFLCRQDDLVLVPQKPSLEFLNGIKQAGFALPEFVELSQRTILADRKLGSLRPWAWGPDSFDLLKPLFPNVTAENRSSEQRFNDGLAQLYSKSWSANFLRTILGRAGSPLPAATTAPSESTNVARSLPSSAAISLSPLKRGEGKRVRGPSARLSPESLECNSWLCPESEIGTSVNSLEYALAAIAAIRARGHHQIVIKESLGLAGSNAIRLFEPDILETHRRWITNALRHKHELVVEPWLDRLLDFSVQLEMSAHGLKLCGFTGLLNDARGQFLGNWAESHFHTRIPTRVVSLFREPKNISRLMLDLYHHIFESLEAELRRVDFVGPIGIDAFVYRDVTGAPRLKPIVEINPRYTMGRVMVELMRQTVQGSSGIFRLLTGAHVHAQGFENFSDYAKALSKEFPIQLEGDPVPRLREGTLALNNPIQAQVCLATFQVTRDLNTLLEAS